MTPTPFNRPNLSDTPWPASWEPPTTAEEPAWEPPKAAELLAPAAPQFEWAPTSPTQPAGSASVAQWLDEQERDLAHPKVVEEGLRRAGWYPGPATMEAARYRTRFNEHHLGYSALLVSTGVAALAGGTLGHVLASGIDHGINRNTLAFWLTALLVTLPFAVWAHIWATHVDRDDPVAVWSKPRRWLSGALVWGCGIVGIARLMIYAAQLVGSLVGASWARGDSAAVGALNVAITVGIALPLGLWAFHFRHRFDDEDPTRPGQQVRHHNR